MLDFLRLGLDNFLSPVILFFVLGVGAAALRSDLEIPRSVGKALSLYLLFAIGFKGGVSLSETGPTAGALAVVVAAVGYSLLAPVLAFALLRATTRLDVVNAAAVAAAYGSVSAVTFVTAVAFLEDQALAYAGYLVAVLALMEMPAIVSGLMLARRGGASDADVRTRALLREALTSGSVLLLVGSLAIGWITGAEGMEALGPVVVDPFQGILAVFLLDMGLIVMARLGEARALMSWRLVAFGLYMPLIGAAVGLLVSRLAGLGVGDGLLLTVLTASASYIAVPAALRQSLPAANPSIYVTMSLAVTFPFNIVVGIPLYYVATRWLLV